jgi:hypothetical protein
MLNQPSDKPFGPFYLIDIKEEDGKFLVLELGDEYGNVLHRPKRFLDWGMVQEWTRQGKSMLGKQVTTETSNPHLNPREHWWKSFKLYQPISVEAGEQIGIFQSSHSLTSEQNLCVEEFSKGKKIKIIAFAGAGKTTTLHALAKSTKRPGLYLAFGRTNAEEASVEFPPSVKCSTTHALAYGDLKDRYDKSKLSTTLTSSHAIEFLNLTDLRVGGNVKFTARQLGQLTINIVKSFCYSSDKDFDFHHVELPGFIQFGKNFKESEKDEFRLALLLLASNLWNAMIDASSEIPLGHDGYLKLWSLSKPKLPYDYILLDEAQDTNNAVLSVLENQAAQVVYVGDKYQQIYQWRGAINALTNTTADVDLFLTKTHRFGAEIANLANKLIERLGEEKRIIGGRARSIPSFNKSVTVICRTNLGVLEEFIAQKNNGAEPFIRGGPSDLLRLLRGVQDLKVHRPSSHPDLYGFSTWQEVVAFSQVDEGASFRTLVSMVSKYNLHSLIEHLEGSRAEESEAKVVISTAHKSKGAQWENIRVNDDFYPFVKSALGHDELTHDSTEFSELCLFYVAITRAKLSIELGVQVSALLGVPSFIGVGTRANLSALVEKSHPIGSIQQTPVSSNPKLTSPGNGAAHVGKIQSLLDKYSKQEK